jgi:2-polyprenyl-3-methyl-5-hydroxy-6-metoxy-1,4-benzoquinol methylase
MNKTVKFWDKQAKGYDKSEEQFEPAFEIIINKTKKYLKKSDVLLDFGCATGSKTFQLAPHVKKVICHDISPKMIEEAEKKAEELKIKNANFRSGTIFDKDLSNVSYDVVVSFGVLHLLNDNEKVMKRINDLLKPGGYFISSTACLKEKMSIKSKIEFSLYMFVKKIGLFPLHLNMYTCHNVVDIVSKDFEIVESEKLFHGIHMAFVVAKKK